MTFHILRVAALACVIAAATSLRADDEIAALRIRLQSAEESVAKLLRIFPPEPPDEATRAQIEKRAARAGIEVQLSAFSKTERILLADGHPSPLEVTRLDISSQAEMGAIAMYLEMLAYSARPFTVESLRIVSDRPGAVRLSARIAIAHYSEPQRDASAPQVHDVKAAIRARLTEQELVRDVLLSASGPTARTVVAPLAALTEAVGENAVGLKSVAFDRGFSIEGIAVGGAARAALIAALEAAHLKVTSLQIDDAGICRKFVVQAQLREPEASTLEELVPEIKVIAGNGLFVSPSAQCEKAETLAPKAIVVRGSEPNGIALKYRNGDLAELFNVLSEVSGSGFLVAPDVTGRISIDVENATVEQTLDALKQRGIFTGPPPLRRVTRVATAVTEPEETFSGERVSFLLRDADLRDYLCLFSEISGLKIHLPEAIEAKVTIFARDVEWDRALAGTLSMRGLKYEIRAGEVFISATKPQGAAPKFANACDGGASLSDLRLKLLRLSQLDVSDVDLTALGRVAGEWQGYARVPSGGFLTLKPGYELLDARVTAVDATGVAILTRDGAKRHLSFEPTDATGGAATVAEAYERLQKAAAASDVVAMAALLEPNSRAVLLRDLLSAAIVVHGGGMEGAVPDAQQAKAVDTLMSGMIRSAAEENPPDPKLLAGQDGETRALLRIAFAIRALPLADALHVARVANDALAVVNHQVTRKLIDGHLAQVPKGPLKITRENVERVWGEAGGRRIEFVRVNDRWFAIPYE